MEVKLKLARIEDTVKVQASLMTLAAELAKGKVYECSIKPFRQKRSLDANSYFHVLVENIAKALKIGSDECKRQLNLEYGSLATDDLGVKVGFIARKDVPITKFFKYAKQIDEFKSDEKQFVKYLIYKETHTLDTKEMARLIDGTINDAKELGIETKTPDELAALKRAWGHD